jgi:inner membrane protein
MDNICHTLVGAAMGEAGLKRRAPLAVPTLLIGANLPDIDVASHLWGPVEALAFRRGWTHGVLALLVLPFVLAGIMTAGDRLAARLRSGRVLSRPADLLLLSAVSIASHPLLDLLNTYGVRWLMPFSPSWSFGDTLFIVDPWVWAVLALGLIGNRWKARRHGAALSAEPAQWALTLMGAYVLVMASLSWSAGRGVEGALAAAGAPVERVMTGPDAITPLRRGVILQTPSELWMGSFHWLPHPTLRIDGRSLPRNHQHPVARAAAQTAEGRRFLAWSRFPFYLIDSSAADVYQVRMMDARYQQDWASVRISVRRGGG